MGLRLAPGARSLTPGEQAASGFGEDATSAGGRPALPVGEYANRLKRDFQGLERVEVTGELADVRRTRVQTYFQMRDERGGVPCAIWNNELDALDLPPECMRDGAAVVARGGPDYYPGGRNASPGFSFRVTELRPAGEGDLLARLAALRKQFEREGLLETQKKLRRPVLPKRIGVITAEGGAARDDLLAGLERRGWFGEIVWAFAPVQDRKAAPAITRAVSDLAALADVEAIVVSRGGGSLTDLWAFCDEDLCRTVAMLAVPVYSAVGHERDTTLIDDVSAVRCSTPTHAAEAVVGFDLARARSDIDLLARRLESAGASAIATRAAPLAARAAAPARAVRAQRSVLDQKTREVRAASERGLLTRRDRIAVLLSKSLSPASEPGDPWWADGGLRTGGPRHRHRGGGAELAGPRQGARPQQRGHLARPRSAAHPRARFRPGRGRNRRAGAQHPSGPRGRTPRGGLCRRSGRGRGGGGPPAPAPHPSARPGRVRTDQTERTRPR